MEKHNFISGIYNYCDRWCEKCNFADRCRLNHNQKKQFNALEDKDDFMSIVSQNLKDVSKLLIQAAEERGIDLNDIEEDNEAYEEEIQKSENARNHPLTKMAQAYDEQTLQWLDSNEHLDIYKQKYLKNIDLGIALDKSDKHLRLIEEALNIIQWYVFQIPVKISSAVRFYPYNPEFEDELNNMYLSSAKIALIGIENSMKAWQSLLEIIKDEEDFIVETLISLQKLKTSLHKAFPLLSQYKRPFFDD